jgi:hypothetical protein
MVDLFEYMMMHGLANPKPSEYFNEFCILFSSFAVAKWKHHLV